MCSSVLKTKIIVMAFCHTMEQAYMLDPDHSVVAHHSVPTFHDDFPLVLGVPLHRRDVPIPNFFAPMRHNLMDWAYLIISIAWLVT